MVSDISLEVVYVVMIVKMMCVMLLVLVLFVFGWWFVCLVCVGYDVVGGV